MPSIQNNYIKASFLIKGAELCSLQDNQGTEYLWQADSQVWGRHAPILFPIVGKLYNDSYKVAGKTYHLPQHGFARDSHFEVKAQGTDWIIFQLSYSEETLIKYPYKFRLEIMYQLRDNSLEVGYDIYNEDDQVIYASIGAHPGFKCPLASDEKRSDYSLVFEQKETAVAYLLDGGNFNGKTIPILENTQTLPITAPLFDNDALVFKQLNSEAVSIVNESGKTIIRCEFAGFPYLGIWSKNQTSPFVCIEPWLGIADTKGYEGEFSEKEGVLPIAIGEQLSCMYCIYVGEATV